MTKEDMLREYYADNSERNYTIAQEKIREAMKNGEKYVYLPGKNNRGEFSWCATPETIVRLREDGFNIDEVWEPWEYWSVEWGYNSI